ncbi:hypothetical protein [Kitasatospora sp. NPDC059327]|uniref:hypothetical protein n=1 Tax=Kitasatospora sp. NPDC059327 TaxID=3346803 RepID=UPI0036A2CBAC
MTRTQNTAPGAAGVAQLPQNSSAPVCVDAALITLASSVLDHCVPTPPSATTAPSSASLANRLRDAAGVGAQRTPSRSLTTPLGYAPGRLERDVLAATIDRLLRSERRGLLLQVDTTLLYETVQTLRQETTRWAGEPLGIVSRRLWEHLYLCIPLTSIAVTTRRP